MLLLFYFFILVIMSYFSENLTHIKNQFKKTKSIVNNSIYWLLVFAFISQFSWIISDSMMLQIWVFGWITSLYLILSHVSTDVQYLEKRIENIESELINIINKINPK